MNWRILSNALRNAMTVLGVAGTMGYFAGSKAIGDALGLPILAGMVWSLYWFESRFRELRLARGWYR